MILEWLEARLTPASKLARQFGLVYHSVALKHRYKRCKSSWNSHVENCHRVIQEAVDKVDRKNHIIILGSAHLHEIPREILEKKFKKVTLVDLVHPLSIRLWARKFPHIELVEKDLSHFLFRMNEFTDAELLLSEIQKNPAPFEFSADLIISANLISQLHLITLDYLSKKKILSTKDFNDRIGQAFSNQHLAALKNCSGNILLYGDRETIYRDSAKNITYQGSFSVDFTNFKLINRWTWFIAPLGEFSKRESIEMKVEAYTLNNDLDN